jgi:lipopolysaccharide transport system permease protein
VWEFVSPLRAFKALYAHRSLIRQLAWAEIVGQFKATYLGMMWSILNPLMTLVVYTLVFGVFLKASFGASSGAGRLDFPLNLFCGLIVYNVFSGTVGRAPALIVGNPNYVKRVVFPLETLPVAVLASSLVTAAGGLAILLPLVLFTSAHVSPVMALFVLMLIPLCACALGAAWLLSSIGVFLRDIGQALQVLLQLLFFASPVIYPLSAVPDFLQPYMALNPLTPILEGARRTLIQGSPPDWPSYALSLIISLIVMQTGYCWFMKTKRAFADVL